MNASKAHLTDALKFVDGGKKSSPRNTSSLADVFMSVQSRPEKKGTSFSGLWIDIQAGSQDARPWRRRHERARLPTVKMWRHHLD